MKRTTKTGLIALVCLLAISCNKESINKPSFAIQSPNNSDTRQGGSFFIGESYGGGVIFYIDSTGLHGLIAATNDQGEAAWYNGTYTVTGATGKAIGTGSRNTKKIIASQGKPGSYAALLCRKYGGGGFSDWFLPSKNELNELYKQRDVIGNFSVNRYYWSSTELDSLTARVQLFPQGDQTSINKNNIALVRAIRTF